MASSAGRATTTTTTTPSCAKAEQSRTPFSRFHRQPALHLTRKTSNYPTFTRRNLLLSNLSLLPAVSHCLLTPYPPYTLPTQTRTLLVNCCHPPSRLPPHLFSPRPSLTCARISF